jgi:hypothetical protein
MPTQPLHLVLYDIMRQINELVDKARITLRKPEYDDCRYLVPAHALVHSLKLVTLQNLEQLKTIQHWNEGA